MASGPPGLVILNDNLRAPPRAGEHIHLLSLARAASRHLPTRIVCWVPEPAAPEFDPWRLQARADADGAPLVLPLAPGREPPAGLTRTRRYVHHAGRWIDRHAPRGSVIWIRRHPTALFMLPRLLDPRQRRRFRFLYDASSFLRLECEAGGRDRATLLKAMLEERLWRRFDLVRVLSAPMKEYLVDHAGLPAERVLVIPVGAEATANHWRPQPTARPARRVLYVGSASAWQGLGELLAAMRILAQTAPEIHLTVVGVERAAFAADAAGANVEFHGQLSHRQATAMYLEH